MIQLYLRKPRSLMQRLTSLFLLMGLLLLSNCSTVKIPDHVACLNKGPLGAHCAHTNVAKTYNISAADWQALSFGQVCTADDPDHFGQTFADIKAALEKVCSICNCCSFSQQEQTEFFFTDIKKHQQQLVGAFVGTK